MIDAAKLESWLEKLLCEVLMLQATSDDEGTRAFFDRYAVLDAHAENAIAAMNDIRPVYPANV